MKQERTGAGAMRLSLDTMVLRAGSHATRDRGVCAMEMVAFLAGEPHSDAPACTSPVLVAFVRRWNDDLPDDATRTRLLRPLLPRLIGTVGSEAVEQRRADLVLDWAVRVSTPAWLDLAHLAADAAALRSLRPLRDPSAVLAAQPVLGVARAHASVAVAAARAAAWDAAVAAARDAAWDAAWAAAVAAARAAAVAAARDAAVAAARAAAWDAAVAAARAAAVAAAWDAAVAAAWAAAGDAVGDAVVAAAVAALQPTVAALQSSALDLLDRLITLPDGDAGVP